MAGIVCEGGAYRCSFTAGVLDALLDQNFFFKNTYGVSAGAANALSYVSGQRGRNLEVTQNNLAYHGTMGYKNFLKCRSIMDLDYVFRTVPYKLVLFDMDAFFQSKTEMHIGVTNLTSGQCEYFKRDRFDPEFRLVQATCSIPLLFPSVKLYGQRYLDGGIADPIPLGRAIADGNQKNLVILTRPRGFIKTQSKQDRLVFRMMKLRYPKFAAAVLNRYQVYNTQTALCAEEEKRKKAVVLAPLDLSHYSSFEKSLEKQTALYQEGYHAVIDRLEDIRLLLDEG